MSLWLVENSHLSTKLWSRGSVWWRSAVVGVLDMASAWKVGRGCRRSARGGGRDVELGGGFFGGRRFRLRRGDGQRRFVAALCRQPLVELGARHRAHHDRHERVVLAAKLRALAAVDA